ncbi:MAG: DUF4743 domain-containing protein [Magnetovibrionaceae bacterium]
MSLLDRLPVPANSFAFVPWRAGGQVAGYVRPGIRDRLLQEQALFVEAGNGIALHPDVDAQGPGGRSAAIMPLVQVLHEEGLTQAWRDEPYAVMADLGSPLLMTVERAAVPLLGTIGLGVHINGYRRDPDGLKMWLGRRALDKPTGAGKLDQVVAGGQPYGITLADNIAKECAEEAGFDFLLAGSARPCGAVSYVTERKEGLRRDVLYVFDLEIPEGVIPENTDGEVEDFRLWPVEKVLETLETGDAFKFNCALVALDFLIRHGVISPEHPAYNQLLCGLHQPVG